MLLDNVFFYSLIGLGIILSLPALWLLVRARWTARYEKLRVVAERSIWTSFFIGILPTAILGLIIGGILKKVKTGDIGALAADVLLLGFTVTWALSALTGLAALIGDKLSPASQNDPFKSTLRGGIVLVFVFSMPFIGWFALLPIAIITGIGINVRLWFLKKLVVETQQ